MTRKTAKSRRGRGEGGIRYREDKELWEARLSLGFGPDGKRVRKTVYGESKAEVGEKLRKLQAEHDAGRLVETEEITTREYLTRWLNNTAKEAVGVATWERYRQLVEIYLVPILGGVKLHKLRPLHVEQCYAAMKEGTTERKAAGTDTRKSAGVILSTALKHAVQMKLIPHNPAMDVKKAKPAVREMAFMTQPQAKRWLAAAKSNQNYALFAAALGSGARQGELLGLAWTDLDLERGTLDVRRALAQVIGKVHPEGTEVAHQSANDHAPDLHRGGTPRPPGRSAEGRENHRAGFLHPDDGVFGPEERPTRVSHDHRADQRGGTGSRGSSKRTTGPNRRDVTVSRLEAHTPRG